MYYIVKQLNNSFPQMIRHEIDNLLIARGYMEQEINATAGTLWQPNNLEIAYNDSGTVATLKWGLDPQIINCYTYKILVDA